MARRRNKAEVLFRIVCKELSGTWNVPGQEPERVTCPGGHIYEVIAFLDGETYATSVYNGTTVQFVPWSMARRLTDDEEAAYASMVAAIKSVGFERALAAAEAAGAVWDDHSPPEDDRELAEALALAETEAGKKAAEAIRALAAR